MKRPLKLHAQRQSGQARIDCLVRGGRIRSHIWSFPESQIFYVAALFREKRSVAGMACAFLNRGAFPFILEFSPKNGHSTLNLGIKITLQFHLLSTRTRIEYGSGVVANLNIRTILNPSPSGFPTHTKCPACKKEFTVLNIVAPITPVLAEHYG